MYRLTITTHQRDRWGMDRAQMISSDVYSRWSQALAHAIDGLVANAENVDGFDPTNADYWGWKGAYETLCLSAPQEPCSAADPNRTVYMITKGA